MCRGSMVASLGSLGSIHPQAPTWCELLSNSGAKAQVRTRKPWQAWVTGRQQLQSGLLQSTHNLSNSIHITSIRCTSPPPRLDSSKSLLTWSCLACAVMTGWADCKALQNCHYPSLDVNGAPGGPGSLSFRMTVPADVNTSRIKKFWVAGELLVKQRELSSDQTG